MNNVESSFPFLRSPAAAFTLGTLVLLLAWDGSGLDLALARLAGGPNGFPWRDHWLVSGVLHEWARPAGWLVAAWLLGGVWWPTGVLRALPRSARLQWAASFVLALLLINWLKQSSATSCPWDLAPFGGAGQYLSHWAWGRVDGGPGRCFPAGHAATGFAFIGGYFALRDAAPRHALRCLWASAVAGLALGLAQQLRGAHFMSHTLWTGWLCWAAAWAVDLAQPGGRTVEASL
jgi:membrane-associated PAP2 superfamily phosphatase